jgi:hypothetical protein
MHELETPIDRGVHDDWEPAETYAKACEIVASLRRSKPALGSGRIECGICHPAHHN